jgi:anaerobic magnesium-protoporphyrin IX monomethyl ester cyclase
LSLENRGIPLRVLFVNPVPAENKKVYVGYNHGIGYLSAVAKARGHETALVTISGRDETLLGRVGELAPDVVALTGTSGQWPLAAWAAGRIARALPDVPIIAGGVHSTVATEEVIGTPGVWAACRGEGETALVEMLSGLEFGEWEETQGFWTRPQVVGGIGPTPIVKQGEAAAAPTGEIIRNAPAALVDLAALPHPDREIYDYQAILDRNRNNVGAEFMASRGCPFTCSYCINPVMSELTCGDWQRVRYRTVEDVVAEIVEVLGRYTGVKVLGFHDDIFGLDKRWLREFAGVYAKRVGLPFWCNERVGTFDEDDVRVLKAAGCFRVHMGIESADDTLRRDILGRDISSEEIEAGFALLKKHGLRTVAFNMIGVPYETEETVKATINLNRRIRPDWLVVSIFSPFPGTRLRDLAKEKGWLVEGLPESYYEAAWALDQPSISRERLIYYYEHFVELVYDKKPARGAR